jgi:hypothetical protein
MKRTIKQLLCAGSSIYIVVKKDGKDVIRVSGHLPKPANLLKGKQTKGCKNVYLIFVKSAINLTRNNGSKLALAIRLMESKDADERKRGEIYLNNLVAGIGADTQKGTNYLIIDGNTELEIDNAVKIVKQMLKTSVFKPLKHI